MRHHFLVFLFSPPNAGNIASLKRQSSKRALNTSPVKGSRYRMMEAVSYPTYIPNLL
ncbi:hypothetical protein Hanom_Chr10g00931501 [Helianthus anomalus]